MAHTTTNIHGVKSIRVVPTVFRDFVSHLVVFELIGGGEVTVSGFAPELLSVDVQEPASAIEEAPETA
ncbi:hypothetical protein [Variovorax sp. GT1P44]|uniref:hypothetical protein n=1 Tax=Variovorax sp. GT1P44 TaxID=3443742 RepID=UPI003F4637A5